MHGNGYATTKRPKATAGKHPTESLKMPRLVSPVSKRKNRPIYLTPNGRNTCYTKPKQPMSFEVALKVPHAQNILLGKRGRDYSIAENLAVLIALKGCWDQKVGEYPRNPVDYFNYKWKKADKGFVAAALAGNTNTSTV